MSVNWRRSSNISKNIGKNRNIINSHTSQQYSREQGINKSHRMRLCDFQIREVYFPNHILGPSVFSFYFDSLSSLNKFETNKYHVIPCFCIIAFLTFSLSSFFSVNIPCARWRCKTYNYLYWTKKELHLSCSWSTSLGLLGEPQYLQFWCQMR